MFTSALHYGQDERVGDVKTLCTVFSGHTKSVDRESGPFSPLWFSTKQSLYTMMQAQSRLMDKCMKFLARNSRGTLWLFSGTSFL